MKRIAAFILSLVTLPSVAFAASIPFGQTPTQLLTTIAAVEAQQASLSSGRSLACVALFSTSTAQVGENVSLAWGSVGALDPATSSSSIPMWTPNGGSTLTFSKAATWTYSFTFYSGSGANVTCNAKIVVTK